jgi:RepB DNA-primase N-terminal domain/RepB DNA-primase C-terminal helical domain
MNDRGVFVTRHAIRRQLAAMPNELYLIRLIHQQSRRPFPGERLWTATQLLQMNAIRFLRARNCEGCDIYIYPFAGNQNAGYILVDLDAAGPGVLDRMQADGLAPCVVLQTSPGHLQAWIHLSTTPLEPTVASAAGMQLARAYGGDLACTDWRHLGRLAGFTNQKPSRRTLAGLAPWVRVVHAGRGLASRADALLHSARAMTPLPRDAKRPRLVFAVSQPYFPNHGQATDLYQDCVSRWHITQRFRAPDWSIVDLWVARHLLFQGMPAIQVAHVLRLASPQFPRRHNDPEDYLSRTLARAAFPAPGGAVCGAHGRAPAVAVLDSACSNSTGGTYPNAECRRF